MINGYITNEELPKLTYMLSSFRLVACIIQMVPNKIQSLAFSVSIQIVLLQDSSRNIETALNKFYLLLISL